jgi:hypothetical protein
VPTLTRICSARTSSWDSDSPIWRALTRIERTRTPIWEVLTRVCELLTPVWELLTRIWEPLTLIEPSRSPITWFPTDVDEADAAGGDADATERFVHWPFPR